MYFLLLKKEILLFPPVFPPQAVPCHYLKLTFSLGLPEMLLVNWLEHVILDLSAHSLGSPRVLQLPSGWSPQTWPQMSAPDKSREQGSETHHGLLWRMKCGAADRWGEVGAGAPSSCSPWEVEGCQLCVLFFGRCGGGYSCFLRIFFLPCCHQLTISSS